MSLGGTVTTTVPREMVSCYVRRFGGWTQLRAAIAGELGIRVEDVLDLDAGGGPPVYIHARTQHGDFDLSLELFIDTARVTAYRGKMDLLLRLLRALHADILCDDALALNPYRRVLIKPDGTRFEVFEDANQQSHMLVLDATSSRVASTTRLFSKAASIFHTLNVRSKSSSGS